MTMCAGVLQAHNAETLLNQRDVPWVDLYDRYILNRRVIRYDLRPQAEEGLSQERLGAGWPAIAYARKVPFESFIKSVLKWPS
jgi:hypothetical protein